MIPAEDSFLILYEKTKNLPPYKANAVWCPNAEFKKDELLSKKREFKVNETFHPKKLNRLASRQGFEPRPAVLETDMLPLH